METKISWKTYSPINIENADDLKDYILCMYSCMNHSVALDTVFLVDRKNNHVYEYKSGQRATDTTKSLLKNYNKNIIGDYLVDMLLKKSNVPLNHFEILYNTNDVLDMLDVVQDLRIYQAEFVLKCAKRKQHPSEEFAAHHFGII